MNRETWKNVPTYRYEKSMLKKKTKGRNFLPHAAATQNSTQNDFCSKRGGSDPGSIMWFRPRTQDEFSYF